MVRKYIPKGFTQSGDFISQNAEKRDIKNIAPDLANTVAGIVQQLSLNIHEELKEATPVLTGWAKANWTISVGGFKTGVWGDRPNPPRKNSFVGGFGEALDILGNYTLKKGTVWIVNNVPYIQVIVNGVTYKNGTRRDPGLKPAGMTIEEILNRSVQQLDGASNVPWRVHP